MKIQAIKGMNDIVAPESRLWQMVESKAREVCRNWGYEEVRTPIVESTALFHRGVGEGTDIVEKEMYTFEDRNGDSLSLRPEGTAGVVRACVEHGWTIQNSILKLFYIGAMYRHEKPQKGRYRQFHQFGIELFGPTSSRADAEVIALGWEFLKQVGVKGLELRMSTLASESCRKPYLQKLTKILKDNIERVPQDFRPRIETNPLRIFDHKSEEAKALAAELPRLMDSLDEESAQHFEGVKRHLTDMGIPFVIDPNVVRGLDYYVHTAFEYVSSELGRTQNAVGGGGRYDGLVELMGGRPTPAVGFGIGLERVLMLLSEKSEVVRPDLFVAIPESENAEVQQKSEEFGFKLAVKVRSEGHYVEVDLDGRSMKGQMKRAVKLNSRFVLIVGENEVQSGKVVLKDMDNQSQVEVPMSQILDILSEKL
ncbi:MAG: histidine--tRNA ligase [Bdellovibrionales bacterium]|nr:histidine--tRNA ligase [Bdellovibrionales bacterium]